MVHSLSPQGLRKAVEAVRPQCRLRRDKGERRAFGDALGQVERLRKEVFAGTARADEAGRESLRRSEDVSDEEQAAAIGSAPMVVYARVTRCDPPTFAATMQPLGITVGVPILVMRTTTGAPPVPDLSATWLLLGLAAMAAGLLIGNVIARAASHDLVSRVVFTIAGVGAVITIIGAFT